MESGRATPRGREGLKGGCGGRSGAEESTSRDGMGGGATEANVRRILTTVRERSEGRPSDGERKGGKRKRQRVGGGSARHGARCLWEASRE